MNFEDEKTPHDHQNNIVIVRKLNPIVSNKARDIGKPFQLIWYLYRN